MPRTRNQTEDEVEEPTISMSQDQFMAMMQTLQQSQADMFARLISETRTSTPIAAMEASMVMNTANFSKCTSRFDGTAAMLDGFIDAIDVYKNCLQISDENAVKGLSMLLIDSAALWWQGVRLSTSSWQDAIDKLRSAFGERRPPFRIYQELFALKQGTDPTDLFISKTRALLSRIPEEDLTEKVQLDMVYGLLDRRIKKRLDRNTVTSFDQLLKRARTIEESLEDGATSRTSERKSTLTVTSTTSAKTIDEKDCSRPATKKWERFQGRKSDSIDVKTDKKIVSKQVQCFGCGTPNVIRSKCEKCKASSQNAFFSMTVTSDNASLNVRDTDCRDIRRSKGVRPTATAGAHEPPRKARRRPKWSRRRRYVPAAEREPPAARCLPTERERIDNAPRCERSATPSSVKYGMSGNPTNSVGVHSIEHSNDCVSKLCKETEQFNDCGNVCFNHSRDYEVNKNSCQKTMLFYNSKYNNMCSSYNTNFSTCNESTYVPNNVLNVGLSKGNCLNNGNGLYQCKQDICKSESYRQVPILDGNKTFSTCKKDDDITCLDLSSYDLNMDNVVNKGLCKESVVRTQGCIQGELNYCRPLLQINILGENGTAMLDTGAKGCIAGQSLHQVLIKKGHPLKHGTRNIRLADGCTRLMDVLIAEVLVNLGHKSILTEFIIFPDAQNNESLLGIDFINKASLVIDFKRGLWHFSEKASIKYKLLLEPLSPRCTSYAAMKALRDNEGTGLQAQERDELTQLLLNFKDVFEPVGEPTPYVVHHIDTGNHAPVATPPYRLTPAKKEIMQQELNKMLAEDIVEDCESAWGAPALLVPKRDGSFRFCVDYRKLNSITKTDAYPMPRIDELLQATKRGQCHMTTIDLRSGYWQVSVDEEDRDKTAFVTPFGTYRFKRMPFGLKNGPATFQRLIDRMRSSSAFKDVIILGYLDDLLIISEGDFSKHLEDLQKVFEQLRKFKLRANREKCVFVRESVKYLGHVISQEGVSADNDKICAILDMEPPSSLKHLRTFVQTCSWFRKFIPGFSQVAEPLTRLTRKNQTWSWGPEQVEAFITLKKLLTSAPVLIQADYSKPFILHTDASNYALGAVLLQGEKNEERPIEFASRLLSAAERNYSTTEREALAVVWAADRFRGYIDGHPVVIGSDHQPLKWLLSLKSPSGRLVRWALKLQAYNINFEYTPGKINVVADALSRPVCTEESRESCGICTIIVDLPTRDLTELRAEQKADPEIFKIIKELEDTEEVAVSRWTERGYLMERGVLYRYNPDADNESPQLVVPVSMRGEILRECHDAPVAGHSGIERTYLKMTQNYFFPGMRRVVSDYIKSCSTCQRYKATNEKPSGLIQTPILNQRNEVLAIDLFGPLPEGQKGEKWILLVEDTATRWVELYALKEATSVACAEILIEEYFLRFGLPRRVISDNGVQFISAVMQKCMLVLGITQDLIPVYHPQANPAERKNRDMKTHLAILVGTDHPSWPDKLPIVRFCMNSSVCETTGVTPAYLTFARELRSPLEVYNDPKAVLNKQNFVPQITPYLKKFLNSMTEVRDRVEMKQDRRKSYGDKSRRIGEEFQEGDQVLLRFHQLSDASKAKTAKFFPKRDGPYLIKKKVSPTTYLIASSEDPCEILGKFHANELTPFQVRGAERVKPLVPKKKRGRPRLQPPLVGDVEQLDQDRGRNHGLEGEYVARQPCSSRSYCGKVGTPSNQPERTSSRDAAISRSVESVPRRFSKRVVRPPAIFDI